MKNDPNISDKGHDTRFSKTNQPPNESKRVPKYKTWLKKVIRDNKEAFEEKIKDGDMRAWALAFERGYGKETEHVNTDNKIDIKVEYVKNEKK